MRNEIRFSNTANSEQACGLLTARRELGGGRRGEEGQERRGRRGGAGEGRRGRRGGEGQRGGEGRGQERRGGTRGKGRGRGEGRGGGRRGGEVETHKILLHTPQATDIRACVRTYRLAAGK